MTERLELRYGMNPHQVPAAVSMAGGGDLPFRVLNGRVGYINLLDMLKAWQIVRELARATELPAATSLKHTNPLGAGIAIPIAADERNMLQAEDLELSPLATAYARARGADRVAAYGDFIGLSEPMDLATAKVVQTIVSDGVVAPGYAPGVLDILARKKRGSYVVIEVDPAYEPRPMEEADVFGIRFQQHRNDAPIDESLLGRVVTARTDISDDAHRDLLLATVIVKYCQSNAVCVAMRGQAIGIGVGQQSRIDCTRIACAKADRWALRSHERVRALRFPTGLTHVARDNLIDQFVRANELSSTELSAMWSALGYRPEPLSQEERETWAAQVLRSSLSSDGFIPFRDNIDRAAASGVRHIVQPGGSLRDEEVIAAANGHGMVMAFSGLRLFYH